MNISELVIYRNLKHEDLFEDMAALWDWEKKDRKQTRLPVQENWWNWQQNMVLRAIYGTASQQLCLADNENAYTTTCEIRGNAGGTLDMLAKNDYRIFKALFDYDLETLEPAAMWK